jgi:hypothetical protein
MMSLRFGLIGCGKWGRNYIRTAEELGHSIKVIGRGEAMEGVDAIVIATHPSASPGLAVEAIHAGYPVLVEKPAGLSVEEAERIASAARLARYEPLVLIGHQHLFAEGYEALRCQGVPSFAVATFCGPVERDYSATWDYGAHAVAALLGLGVAPGCAFAPWFAGTWPHKSARVRADGLVYDAYQSSAEPPLTSQLRAFCEAVRQGGTDDYRFGAHWAVDVASVLETASLH